MKKIISLILALMMVLSLTSIVSAEDDMGTEVSIQKAELWASSAFVSGDVKLAFDNQKASFWNSNYFVNDTNTQILSKVEPPHAVNVIFPEVKKISGMRYLPRQDSNGGGLVVDYVVFVSVDGVDWKQVAEGKFDYGEDYTDRSAKDISWGDVDARAVHFEIINGLAGFGTASEIDFFTGGKGNPVNNGKKPLIEPPMFPEGEKPNGEEIETDSKGWKFAASSEYLYNKIGAAFDNDLNSFWHTNYWTDEANTKIEGQDEPPHWLTVEFPEVMEISGFNYYPRTFINSGADGGKFQAFNIYSSMDGINYELLDSGSFKIVGGNEGMKVWSWGNTPMKAIKIEVTQGVAKFASAGEIKFLKNSTPSPRVFDYSKWQVEVHSTTKENSSVSWGNIRAIFDDNPFSRWHSYYDQEGNNMINVDRGPNWYITITLPEKQVITGWKYVPRDDNPSGRLLDYDVMISDSDDGEYVTIYHGEHQASDSAPVYVDFGIGVEIKRLHIQINKAYADFGAISDFVLAPAQTKDVKVVPIDRFNDEVYKTYLEPIDNSKFIATANINQFSGAERIEYLFDGSTGTGWLTQDSSAPVTLQLDLGKKHIFKQINVYPRRSTSRMGLWQDFEVKISSDGKKWETLLENQEMDWSLDPKQMVLPEAVETRYVAFVVTKYNEYRVGAAEIEFLQTGEMADSEVDSYKKYILQIGSNDIVVDSDENPHTTTLDVAPYITSVGSTLIPLRGLMEEMGAKVEWFDEDQKIVVTQADKGIKITMHVDYNLVTIEKSGAKYRYTLTVAPLIKDGRTYIPVRFVSEQLGNVVEWEGTTQTITIY